MPSGIYFDLEGWEAYLSTFARDTPAYLGAFGPSLARHAGVDYAEYERARAWWGADVVAVLTGPSRDLIETVATEAAEDLMVWEPSLHAVEVTIHKPNAPIQAAFKDVRLTITRRRDAVSTQGHRTGEAEAPA